MTWINDILYTLLILWNHSYMWRPMFVRGLQKLCWLVGNWFVALQFKTIHYRIGKNFSEDPILALLARLFSSLKLSIANKTSHLEIM